MGVNRLMADEALRTRMGVAGRMRAEKHFSWSSIAAKTHQLYVELVETKKSLR
jgi:glycosyltransferase involved in cell wall biosynthesis